MPPLALLLPCRVASHGPVDHCRLQEAHEGCDFTQAGGPHSFLVAPILKSLWVDCSFLPFKRGLAGNLGKDKIDQVLLEGLSQICFGEAISP